jgi:sulfoxide reductase heme-binding subunit YedZ
VFNSPWVFRLFLALPAIAMLTRFGMTVGGIGQLLQASGEWAARLLIVTLAVTPIRIVFHQFGLRQDVPMWLFQRRRDLGLAAFLYALLHLAVYVARQSSPHVILYEMQFIEYLMGWLAMAAMLITAVISNDWSLRHLGATWKVLQRLVYVAALAVFLHWLWIKLDDIPVLLHFMPLAALEAFRLCYNFSRPSARHRQE